jgi:hypothetical protein
MSFKLGESVFLKTDPEQHENIIVARTEFVGGTVIYRIACNGSTFDVYGCELTDEPDQLKLLNIRAEKVE